MMIQLSETGERVKEMVTGASESTKQSGTEAGHRMGETGHETGHRVQETYEKVSGLMVCITGVYFGTPGHLLPGTDLWICTDTFAPSPLPQCSSSPFHQPGRKPCQGGHGTCHMPLPSCAS